MIMKMNYDERERIKFLSTSVSVQKTFQRTHKIPEEYAIQHIWEGYTRNVSVNLKKGRKLKKIGSLSC